MSDFRANPTIPPRPTPPGFVDIQSPQPYLGRAAQATRRPRGVPPGAPRTTQKETFVNRKELVTAVAEHADLEQKTVDTVLRSLQATLEGAVAQGEKVSVPGFFAV